MSRDKVREVIFSKLATEWVSELGALIFQNQPGFEQKPGSLVFKCQIVWTPTGTTRMGVGGSRDQKQARTTGYLYLHGHAPTDSGTQALNEGLAWFSKIFYEAYLEVPPIGTMKFREVNQQTLGYKEGFYRESALVEFYLDGLT